jgi:hypothetical protein
MQGSPGARLRATPRRPGKHAFASFRSSAAPSVSLLPDPQNLEGACAHLTTGNSGAVLRNVRPSVRPAKCGAAHKQCASSTSSHRHGRAFCAAGWPSRARRYCERRAGCRLWLRWAERDRRRRSHPVRRGCAISMARGSCGRVRVPQTRPSVRLAVTSAGSSLTCGNGWPECLAS